MTSEIILRHCIIRLLCAIMNMIYLFIYLFLPPALNPESYGRARVLEAPSRPMLVNNEYDKDLE